MGAPFPSAATFRQRAPVLLRLGDGDGEPLDVRTLTVNAVDPGHPSGAEIHAVEGRAPAALGLQLAVLPGVPSTSKTAN